MAKHYLNSATDLALPLDLDAAHVDESKAVDLVLEAGQMSLHHVFLMHGSQANRSDNPRRETTLRYMPPPRSTAGTLARVQSTLNVRSS